MELKTVFELKTIAKELGLCGYCRLKTCELVQLLQRVDHVCYIVTFYRLILLIDIYICLVVTAVCLFFIKVLHTHEPMDIDLPSDWLEYDEYADSAFLVYFSDVNDDE